MDQQSAEKHAATAGRSTDPTAFTLALCLGILGLLIVQLKTNASYGIDFYQSWAPSQALPRGGTDGNFYSDEVSAAIAGESMGRVSGPAGSARAQKAAQWGARVNTHGLGIVSTPLYYSMFAALTSGDYDRDLWRFQLASNGLFLLAVITLCQVLGYGGIATTLLIAVLSFAFNPLNTDIEAANVNRIQCALVVLSTLLWHWLPGRSGAVCAGFVLGCVVLFKPNIAPIPIFLAGMWIRNHRREKLIYGAVGIALATAAALGLSAHYFGTVRCWLDWMDALRRVLVRPPPLEYLNLSTARLIYSWTAMDLSVPLTLVLVASFFACVWRRRRTATAPGYLSLSARGLALHEDLSAAGGGVMVTLISAKYVWDHYYLLAIPLAVLLFRPDPGGTWTAVRFSLTAVGFLLCGVSLIALLMPDLQLQQLMLPVALGSIVLWVLLLAQLP